MTGMLVAVAVWAVLSLVVGLTVGRAIRQADSAEFPARPAEWWVRPTAPADDDADAASTAGQLPRAA